MSKPVPGDGARPERILVGVLVGGLEPRRVAFELFDDREQVVRDRRRLRALRVRVHGEDRVAMRAARSRSDAADRAWPR